MKSLFSFIGVPSPSMYHTVCTCAGFIGVPSPSMYHTVCTCAGFIGVPSPSMYHTVCTCAGGSVTEAEEEGRSNPDKTVQARKKLDLGSS